MTTKVVKKNNSQYADKNFQKNRLISLHLKERTT